MPKSISLAWSPGVSEKESEILTETVERALMSLYLRYPEALAARPLPVRVFGNWIIPALFPDNPYWGVQWYLDASYDAQVKQVIAPTYLELVRKEPWQQLEAHYDLVLLDEDLTDFPTPLARLRPDYYSLGTSLSGIAAVFSVYHVRHLAEEHLQELALRRLVLHHLGHALGVPSFARSQQVGRRGLELHCTGSCAMRHASSLEELAGYALEEAESAWPFCALCTADLYGIVISHARDWN
jgi:hypothetical protein